MTLSIAITRTELSQLSSFKMVIICRASGAAGASGASGASGSSGTSGSAGSSPSPTSSNSSTGAGAGAGAGAGNLCFCSSQQKLESRVACDTLLNKAAMRALDKVNALQKDTFYR